MAPDAKSLFHPALAVNNVANHIPVKLDMDNDQYPLWVALFTNHAKSNRVLHHIIAPKVAPTPPSTNDELEMWETLDATVLQWIYSTVTTELLEIIVEPSSTAMEAWTRLADLFQDNQNSRAVTLEQEFSHIDMADFSSVSTYCQRLKSLADQLKNVGSPVSQNRLVLQLVSSLSPAYHHVGTIIRQANPLPNFFKARSMLALEEAGLAKKEATGPSSSATLFSRSNTDSDNGGKGSANSSTNSKGGRGNGGKKKGKSKGNSGNGSTGKGQGNSSVSAPATPSSAATSTQWPGGYGPWQWSPWAYPPCPYPSNPWMVRPGFTPRPQQGILGPRPQQSYSADASSPSQTDIEAAMYTLGLAPPEPWVMDTGATSHMTANQGTLSSFINSSFSNGILVGNGQSIPIHGYGHIALPKPHPPPVLKNVLYAPKLVKNLISGRKFTSDNNVTVEFDPFGFYVKDIRPGTRILRCDSKGDLYPLSKPSVSAAHPSVFAALAPSKPDTKSYDFLDSGLSPFVIHHLTQPNPAQPAPQPQRTDPISRLLNSSQSAPSPEVQSPETNPTTAAQTPDPTSAVRPPTKQPIPPSKPTTRADHGIYKPNPKYVKSSSQPQNLAHTIAPSPIPKNPVSAIRDPNWKLAMDDEYSALINNKTWVLVPRPENVNVTRSMWIFRHKFNSDGSFERYKARLVGDGKTQQVGVDCGETFSLVVKPATIRTVLSIALSHS
ncbi:uncharacterized protein LOC141588661 [Silene latifolia]|uniref:uncharacterized protein LOC141588661 n=1 Tax=Silene latifolia TaxID=37657 RepID=UPI003D770B56